MVEELERPPGFTRWHGLKKDPPEFFNRRIVVIFRTGREFDTIYPYVGGLDFIHEGNSTDIIYVKILE